MNAKQVPNVSFLDSACNSILIYKNSLICAFVSTNKTQKQKTLSLGENMP